MSLNIGITIAQINPTNPTKSEGLWGLVLENDFLGERKEDRNYSNGIRIAWMTEAHSTPEWARHWAKLGDKFAGLDIDLKDVRIEYQFGQSMFTPKDLKLVRPDASDRPYAGLLYASFGILGKRVDDSFEQLQIVLGVVGPSSRAKEVQRSFHKIISATDPQGWNTQIHDRFAAEIRFQRTEPPSRKPALNGLTVEFAPHYGIALGNLNTSASAGFSVRIGSHLPDDFGPPRISPSLPGSGYFKATAKSGWYFFGGLEGRYVYQNLVLEGKPFGGAGVNRSPWVADVQYGVAYYQDDFRIAYTLVTRSREFKEQDTRLSSFGALSLTWAY